ncbi:hypothetical protein X777_02105 [Ooceraea biroi]|uniref:Uncharacterized protein n=1 Tax=Ooceraea biroi TaxID=2015173 RepID=A0A026WNF4_OOCBI|nr:hypothetical protein X777_02105 [Ooceraea biroi]
MRANRTKNSASASFGGSPHRNDGSFLEGGQCAVRQRIDCLRGFTMKWHGRWRENEGEKEKKERVETKERPKEQVRETRVESKWRRGESRVNHRAENATKIRAAKGKGRVEEDDLWLCVAR